MKNIIDYVKILAVLFITLLTINACVFKSPENNSRISIIPKPYKLKPNVGEFKIVKNTKIVIEHNDFEVSEIAEFFADKIKRTVGFTLQIKTNPTDDIKKNVIILSLNAADSSLGGEGYSLDVTQNAVILQAAKSAGLFYGIQTIFQLLPAEIYGDSLVNRKVLWRIPAVKIIDKPQFSWRGMHLDVARHFFPKDAIKKYIDILAMHKLNVLHLHLNDDQGWRIEIKKYPKLVKIGSKRYDLPWNDWQGKDTVNMAIYEGYYTQEDIRELTDYAKSRFVTIVPEIEMPGHTLAALAAYPEYSCTGGPFTVPSGGVDIWNNHTYCLGNEKTYTFLRDILSEVIGLFPSRYIHIGGDETTRVRWQNCLKCQSRIKKENLKDEDGLYGYFIKRIAGFLKSKNRIMIGWDEILEGGNINDVAVMSWRGADRVVKAARRKLKVVVAPSSHLYFDNIEIDGESRITLQAVYDFNPVPLALTKEERKYILGAQGCVWTENVTTFKRVEYIVLPRVSALAENIWTPVKQRNFEDFVRRMSMQYERYKTMKLDYRSPDLEGGFNGLHIFTDSVEVKMIAPRMNTKIRYTLDGSNPTFRSTLYIKPFYIKEDAVLKAAEFLANGKKGRVRNGFYEKQAFLKAVPIARKKLKSGLTYQYVEGKFDSTTQIVNSSVIKKGISESFIFPRNHKKHFFALIYKGFIYIKDEGLYNFYSESNDGSRLYIHDKLIVDNDGLHPAEEKFGAVALKAGFHPISLVYFQNAGASALKVSYEGEKLKKRPIPSSVLFH